VDDDVLLLFCALLGVTAALLPVLVSLPRVPPLEPPRLSSARTRAAFLADVASLLACVRLGSCTTDSPPRPTILPNMLKACGGLVGFVTVELVLLAAEADATGTAVLLAAAAVVVVDVDADES
jgi:hypothetical protein